MQGFWRTRVNRRRAMAVAVLCLGAGLAGCQGGGQAGGPTTTVPAPSAVAMIPVAVMDFAVDGAAVQGDRGMVGQVLGGIRGNDVPFPQQAVTTFSETLVRALAAAGVPAHRLRAGMAPPATGWLVRGRFTSLKQGQTGAQALIGFGAGNPEVAVAGEVVDLAGPGQPRVVQIGDMADGRPMPGALISRNPAVIALKTLRASGSFEREVENLAETVAEAILAEMRTGGR